jgi:hypothetical protein
MHPDIITKYFTLPTIVMPRVYVYYQTRKRCYGDSNYGNFIELMIFPGHQKAGNRFFLMAANRIMSALPSFCQGKPC